MTDPAFRPVESLQATAYIVKRCDEKGIALNVTKLQKLMFCCYGAVLGKFGLRLIDEYPVAWQYGPVFCDCPSNGKRATPFEIARPSCASALYPCGFS